MPTRSRIHAAPLTGRGWLNTAGADLSLASLRGKFVLLDFWTFCCVNCLHVLDELRDLESRHRDTLVIVGVHSPKFAHEVDPHALAAAVERYDVRHPVLDDPDLTTWKAYAARAWPTLTLIDPEGYVAAQMSGEGHAPGLEALLTDLAAEHERRGTLHRGDGPYVPPVPADTDLRFPGKVVALPGGTLLVSDTAHHQLVEMSPDLATVLRRIGCGTAGLRDGDAPSAAFDEPQGLLVLPDPVAAAVGYQVLVADTVNHALRGVRLDDGSVTTVAGTGRQLRQRSGAGPALHQDLSSPWDLAWFRDRVAVAMAGTHQLWWFDPLAPSPGGDSPAAPRETAGRDRSGTVGVLAGTSAEGLRDGPAAQAWFAQPSGLSASQDGSRLWVADSETSALRHLDPDPGTDDLAVHTDVGTGLFDFGHVDGPAATALMQHPLGVTALPDGSVAVCDTYNGAVRRFDPASGEMSTLATGLVEPSGATVETDPDGVRLVVVESAAHRLVRVPIPPSAQQLHGPARHTRRPPTPLAPGDLALRVEFVPPTGQKLDARYGDPTMLSVSATPASLLVSGGGASPGLARTLRLSSGSDGGVLHVSVQAAACDGDPDTGEVPEFAACHLYQQDWGIPVTVQPGSPAELVLPLRAT